MNKAIPREQLIPEIIQLVTDSVNLQHLDKSTLNAETSLTQGGLGLDSVDILEVVVAVEHRYGIKVDNAENGKQVFRNFGTIADFILSK